jgi:hypothetical protein
MSLDVQNAGFHSLKPVPFLAVPLRRGGVRPLAAPLVPARLLVLQAQSCLHQ